MPCYGAKEQFITTDLLTGNDTVWTKIVAKQFDSILPENVLKWERAHLRLTLHGQTKVGTVCRSASTESPIE